LLLDADRTGMLDFPKMVNENLNREDGRSPPFPNGLLQSKDL